MEELGGFSWVQHVKVVDMLAGSPTRTTYSKGIKRAGSKLRMAVKIFSRFLVCVFQAA